jgi:hypothetical protein
MGEIALPAAVSIGLAKGRGQIASLNKREW